MKKSGGVVRMIGIQQAYVVSLYALLLIAIVMAALALERFGQLGTLSVLAVMAASGLPWLTSRVRADGEADDTPKNERIADGAGADARDER